MLDQRSSYEAEDYDVNANILKILKTRGVPQAYLQSRLSDFPVTIESKIDSESGYFIYGPVGVGKTHLAISIMADRIIKNSMNAYLIGDCVRGIYDARFIPVTTLLNRIKSSFSPDSIETEGDIIERVSGSALLVIDDIGAEKVTEWTLQTLYTIVDIRSREKKPMIVTSNLPLDAIAEKLSDRIASRIIGLCKPLELSGADKRLSNTQSKTGNL